MQLYSIYQFQRSATAVSGNMPQFRAVAGLQKNTVVTNDEERARYFRKSGFEKPDGKNIQVIGRLIQNKQPERFAHCKRNHQLAEFAGTDPLTVGKGKQCFGI